MLCFPATFQSGFTLREEAAPLPVDAFDRHGNQGHCEDRAVWKLLLSGRKARAASQSGKTNIINRSAANSLNL